MSTSMSYLRGRSSRLQRALIRGRAAVGGHALVLRPWARAFLGRSMSSTARLKERREVAAAADLRDRQLDLARPRRPRPRPIPVAMGQPLLGRPLAVPGPHQLGHLRLHQLLHDPGQRLTQEVEPVLLKQVADDLLNRHPLRLGHRGDSPLVGPWQEPTSLSAAVAGLPRLRPTPSYTTLWDVTPGLRTHRVQGSRGVWE